MNTEYILKNDERSQSINKRLLSRIQPSHILQPYFDPRPQETKYTKMPIYKKPSISFPVDKLTPIKRGSHIYNLSTQFNPGDNAPYEGYAINVDNESTLKNIFLVNQKHSTQSHYIPSSTSDLYNITLPVSIHNDNNIHHYVQQSYNPIFTNGHDLDYIQYTNNNPTFNHHSRQHIKTFSI